MERTLCIKHIAWRDSEGEAEVDVKKRVRGMIPSKFGWGGILLRIPRWG